MKLFYVWRLPGKQNTRFCRHTTRVALRLIVDFFFLCIRDFTSAISIPRQTMWLKRTKEQTLRKPQRGIQKTSRSYSARSYCVSRAFVSAPVSLLPVTIYAQRHAESIVRFVSVLTIRLHRSAIRLENKTI